MLWVFLEVALALGLAVGIVWWTFPKAKKAPPDSVKASESPSDQEKKP